MGINIERVNLKFYLNEIDCLLEFQVEHKDGESVFSQLVDLTKKLRQAGAVSSRPVSTNKYYGNGKEQSK